MRFVVTLQVRMGSERLPGKVMRYFAGKPMIWHLITRLRQCQTLDEVIVATAESEENDVIESFCIEEGVYCYRGSEEDVLGRMRESLDLAQADIGVVVYGDNPLIDPTIVDEHIRFFQVAGDYDWVGNNLKTTFPPGMEVEVFTLESLTDAANRTADPKIREHGTLFIRQNPSIYRLHNIEATGPRFRPDIYLGVDTAVDAQMLDVIFDHFQGVHNVSLEQILCFIDLYPDLAKNNKHVFRRWRQYRHN